MVGLDKMSQVSQVNSAGKALRPMFALPPMSAFTVIPLFVLYRRLDLVQDAYAHIFESLSIHGKSFSVTRRKIVIVDAALIGLPQGRDGFLQQGLWHISGAQANLADLSCVF